MITLKGKNIYLRALESIDIDFVYAVENDETIWEVSHTQTPYSRFLIRQYLKNAQQDIYEAKQLRLAICNIGDENAIGLIDIFDFDPKNNRAGIGILIKDTKNRSQGVGSEALELVIKYCFVHLNLHQLYANISTENKASLRLFTKFQFIEVGTKKEWNLINGAYKDETLFQLMKN